MRIGRFWRIAKNPKWLGAADEGPF